MSTRSRSAATRRQSIHAAAQRRRAACRRRGTPAKVARMTLELDPAKAALLVVELQNDMVHESNL
jgi:hypothetical protein